MRSSVSLTEWCRNFESESGISRPVAFSKVSFKSVNLQIEAIFV